MARKAESRFDVVIIGAGPAGLFAALELTKVEGLEVAVFEKGADIGERIAAVESGERGWTEASPLVSGFGGAGAFSDGKLTLSPEVGGQLSNVLPIQRLKELIRSVDESYLGYGAPTEVFGADPEEIDDLKRRAVLADLVLIESHVRHVGTDVLREIVKKMRDELGRAAQVRTLDPVETIVVESGKVSGVRTKSGEFIGAEHVIAAPGRSGSDWLAAEAERIGLKAHTNPVDVGVRVEVPAAAMEPLTRLTYEPKLIYYSKAFDDKVRSFCVCPQGEVVTEEVDGVITVNGHSYAHKKTENTNLALLVSTSFTEPFHEPTRYGKYLASLANMLSGGVIVQRFGDLEAGRRSTESRLAKGLVHPTLKKATPGDLSFVLPFRYMVAITDMLKAIDSLAPGVASRHTLLYGIEVKFYSSRIQVDSQMQTDVENLYVAGDGAGLTRGLVQASVSGLVAAQAIVRKARAA
jgi:uncharacterized FAD-dependent dehydrogenase